MDKYRDPRSPEFLGHLSYYLADCRCKRCVQYRERLADTDEAYDGSCGHVDCHYANRDCRK